jgi:hypothetical protein
MAGKPAAQPCLDRWEHAWGVARWRGAARKLVWSMKLPQDKVNEIFTKISF